MEVMAEALVLSESSCEGTKVSEGERSKKSRIKISRIALASDESGPEEEGHQGKPKEETKKRGKSQRRKEKEKCRGALVKQLKEKTKTHDVSAYKVFRNLLIIDLVIADFYLFFHLQESPFPKALNDSGCLLGDNDLFDAQLEEDVADKVLEEEESLDAIRAAMKKKAKNQVRERHKSLAIL